MERNNKRNITALLATIRERRLEGFENPFGLTKVRRASQPSSSDRSREDYDPRKRPVVMGQYPSAFLAGDSASASEASSSSLRLASSNDSLFRHVLTITASQAVAATITDIQDLAASS